MGPIQIAIVKLKFAIVITYFLKVTFIIKEKRFEVNEFLENYIEYIIFVGNF